MPDKVDDGGSQRMAKLLKNAEEVAGEPIIAATLLAGPGIATGGPAGGVIGSVTRSVMKMADERRHGATPRPSPLRVGQPGYLAVTPERVVLMEIKIGAFSNKASGVLADVPREEIQAVDFPGGAAMMPLIIEFTDGTSWHFMVAKVYARSARAVVKTLTG
jgi:hypothetical protein